MGEGDTLINALIGAVVSVVLSFVPFSPVLGGAVAAYLQRGSRREGIRVGAISGLTTAVPLLLIFLLILFLFASVFAFPPFLGSEGLAAGTLGVVVLVSIFVVVLLYGVALSALGGWLGNYVVTDTDL